MPINIFSESFANAVRIIQKRAEHAKISKVFDTFVDSNFFETISKNESQIISGRRGAGKSHLLLYLRESLIKTYENKRIIPIYINLESIFMDFKGRKLANEELATFLFNNLLIQISANLFSFYDKHLRSKVIDRLLGRVTSRKDLRSKLDKLEWIATFGTPLFTKSEISHTKKSKTKKREKSDSSLKVAFNPDNLALGMRFSDEVVEEANLEGEIIRVASGANILKATSVLEILGDAIDTIGAESLYILLDQWSDALDENVQPYFADLIKHVLLSVPNIKVKIATIPTRTKLYVPSARTGFEMERDVYTGIRLDEQLLFYRNKQLPLEFYSTVLRKHIGSEYRELIRDHDPDVRFLINLLFDSMDTFEELIIAGGGIVRDVLILFGEAYEQLLLLEGANRINTNMIDNASLQFCVSNKLDYMKDDKYLTKLYNKLLEQTTTKPPVTPIPPDHTTTKAISSQNEPFVPPPIVKEPLPTFLIPFGASCPEIDTLDMFRLIHKIPANVLSSSVVGKYNAYILDHGIRVMHNMLFSNIDEFNRNTFQVDDEETKRLISKRIVTPEKFKVYFPLPIHQAECPNCGDKIYKTAKLYKEFGICPKCHVIIDEVIYHSK